jgi:hypothetical protein
MHSFLYIKSLTFKGKEGRGREYKKEDTKNRFFSQTRFLFYPLLTYWALASDLPPSLRNPLVLQRSYQPHGRGWNLNLEE